MQKKGQALIEFLIILPVLIFLILGIVDVGKIITIKNQLENDMDYVIDAYQKNQTFEEIENEIKKKKIKIEINVQRDVIKILLKKETSILTPGLNFVFSNPYDVVIERAILNES